MSGRNRGPPPPMKGGSHHTGIPAGIHEPLFGRGLGPMPRHAMFDEMREPQFGMGQHHHHHHRALPPNPAIIEERLAGQHQEIHSLLADNQRLAATHVALKQELEVSQLELQRVGRYADSVRAEKDAQIRELYEKSRRLEVDLRGVDTMRAELHRVSSDIKELTAVRQELTGKVQMMTQDLARINADLQQAPALRADIEAMKQELQRASSAIEYEKKGYAENYKHGEVMEKKLISMARELEKLRAELANAEKRARASAAVAAANPGYPVNYGNPDGTAGYAGTHYPHNYGMNPAQSGAESYPPYGGVPGSWGAYDMQRAQGHMN